MGLLAYNPYDPRMNPMLRNVTPFAQPQAPEGQGAGPVMFPPQAQKPPEPVTPQLSPWASAWQGLTGRDQLKPGASMTDRLNASMESPLFNLGMGIVASSGPGGTGADFAQYMRGYQQQRQQREQLRRQNTREDAADQREQTQFGWQQTQVQQMEAQRADWRRAVEMETDPQRRATLQALGPEGYGEWLSGEQQRAFQAREGQLDRETTLRAAGMRANARPDGAGPGWMRPNGRDQLMMEDFGTATNAARQLLNSDIPRLRDLFSRMIQYDAQGRPLPASMRQTVNRYLQLHPEERAAFEQIESAIWPLVQQRLEGLAPITQFELGQAIARTPSANWTPQGVLEELDNMERAARLTVDLGTRAYDFQGEAGSLTTGRNAQGQSWMDVTGPLYEQYQYRPPAALDRPATAPQAPAREGSVQPTQSDVALLRSDPSATRRRQFDEVYGQGAAARALAANRVQGRFGASRPLY